MSVVLLSGGTGGAKLARGLYELIGDELVVIANTGDDVEIHGAHVSPDPDLVTYWLADRIDERGWGIARRQLRGDGDAAQSSAWTSGSRSATAISRSVCVRRDLLEAGLTLSEAHAELTRALGVRAQVIPMSDDRVRTTIHSGELTLGLQEFLIVHRGAVPIDFDRVPRRRAAHRRRRPRSPR